MKARRPDLAELVDAYEDQRILVEIGRDLIVEKDPERLLGLILDACRRITGADAGSIFLCEEDEEGAAVLRFAYSHTFSRDLPYTSFTMPRDERSIAGYVSLTGDVLNIPDVYDIEPGRSFSFNRGYDLASGYRTKSMLALPMRDHRGRVIGVVQLINSKETPEAERLEVDTGRCAADEVMLERPADFEARVCPFKPRYVPLMEAVANQAAIALENSRMIARIEQQFESFVRASVAAIESRDPATRGHSERVAAMAKALMRATHAEREGLYAACYFGRDELLEIEYAGLLHDYGKVYLDERVFSKARKLYPEESRELALRLRLLARSLEAEGLRAALAAERAGEPGRAEALESAGRREAERVLGAMPLVEELDRPSELGEDPAPLLRALLDRAPEGAVAPEEDGLPLPFLTGREIESLGIRRGSLRPEEYRLIQEHVAFTTDFVRRIPWPPELAGIPDFCAKHHERLDGSGYPLGLQADGIPLQARMLAIADVHDALAAHDRPYKKALPPDRVRAVLEAEARAGKLDAELVRIFFAANCPGAAQGMD